MHFAREERAFVSIHGLYRRRVMFAIQAHGYPIKSSYGLDCQAKLVLTAIFTGMNETLPFAFIRYHSITNS
jgi:hypothetical protein